MQQIGTLAALDNAGFDKKRTMKVYLSPTENAYREDGWQVTTDEKVVIYGVQDGWVLVSYLISGNRGRMGYIEDSTLLDKESVQTLSFTPMEMTLTKNATATADPLFGKGKTAGLTQGTAVQLLAFFGDEWAYVETTLNNKPCRLFIPRTSLM